MRKAVTERAKDMVSVAIAASFILGPGVLGVSGIALQAGGPVGSFLGWIVSAILIAPMVFIFYRMGKRDTSLIGLGQYVEDSLGTWAGLAVNLLFFSAALLIAPLILQVAIDYARTLMPEKYVDGYILGSVALLIGCLINIKGTKWLGWTSSVAFFVITLFLGAFLFHYRHLAWDSLLYTSHEIMTGNIHSMSAIGKVSGIVFFAFIGFENLPVIGGSVKSKNTFVVSYTFITCVYLALALVVGGASVTHTGPAGVGLLGLVSLLPGWKVISGVLVLVLLLNASSTICAANRLLLINVEKFGLMKLRNPKRRALFSRIGLLGLFLFYCNLFNLLQTGKIELASLVEGVNQCIVFAYLLVVISFARAERGALRWVGAFGGLMACGFMIYHSGGGCYVAISLIGLAIALQRRQLHVGRRLHPLN